MRDSPKVRLPRRGGSTTKRLEHEADNIQKQAREYRYYAYLCTKTTETRGTRPSVKTSEPCGRWSVLQTSREITDRSQHQARCKCGNRPRLNGKNTRLFNHSEDRWENHIAAHNWAVRKNREAREEEE